MTVACHQILREELEDTHQVGLHNFTALPDGHISDCKGPAYMKKRSGTSQKVRLRQLSILTRNYIYMKALRLRNEALRTED